MEVGQGRNWGLIKCSFWLVVFRNSFLCLNWVLKNARCPSNQGKLKLCSVNTNSGLKLCSECCYFAWRNRRTCSPPVNVQRGFDTQTSLEGLLVMLTNVESVSVRVSFCICC
jgi:hypothetical protein